MLAWVPIGAVMAASRNLRIKAICLLLRKNFSHFSLS